MGKNSVSARNGKFFLAFFIFFSQEKIVNVTEINQQRNLKESGCDLKMLIKPI